MKKNYMAIVICMALLMVSVLASSCSGAAQEEGASGTETDVRQILDTMSTEQKVAQMIMPARGCHRPFGGTGSCGSTAPSSVRRDYPVWSECQKQ